MSSVLTRASVGYRLFQKFLLSVFRTFYLFEVKGLENVPRSGGVIVAANHINVFDALMIAACVPRRMRFVAWNRTFTLPVIGWFMRVSGCIPIDREKPDMAAFKESLRWLAGDNVLGIFPEGKYTLDGRLCELKPGTARIALSAHATVVPATITGAYRSWPSSGPAKKLFPRPWKVSLKFHPPIAPAEGASPASSDQKTAARELIERIGTAINSTLEPALRAEKKVDRLVEQPASHIRIYEWFLCVVLVVAWVRAQWDWRAAIVAGLYFAYLLVDVYLVRQSVLTRVARNFSPLIVLIAAYPSLARLIGTMPRQEAADAAATFDRLLTFLARATVDWWFFCYLFVIPYILWAMIEYCFRRYVQFQRYMRGFLVTLYLTLLEIMFVPAMNHEYPLAIDPAQRGLYVRLLEWLNPMAGTKLLMLPGLFVALSAFTLAFDFAHNRTRLWGMWFIVLNAWISAVALRGYPLGCVAINFATVAVVFGYMNLFKFRAHDGRRV
jgi:1-acyl-sn-glycerol-3-phosphate acyltransferase